MVVRFDEDTHTVQLALRALDLLEHLQEDEHHAIETGYEARRGCMRSSAPRPYFCCLYRVQRDLAGAAHTTATHTPTASRS